MLLFDYTGSEYGRQDGHRVGRAPVVTEKNLFIFSSKHGEDDIREVTEYLLTCPSGNRVFRGVSSG